MTGESVAARPLCAADAGLLAAMHARAFRDAWNERQLAESLRNPYFLGEALLIGGEFACTVGSVAVLGEADLLFLVTDLPFRRKGYAKKTLTGHLLRLKEAGVKKVTLEVRESNLPARALYEAVGFQKIAERKRYYGDETALIYGKEL